MGGCAAGRVAVEHGGELISTLDVNHTTNTGPVHFITLGWSDERPYLQYRPNPREAHSEHLEIAFAKPLTITLSATRLCIGYYDFVNKHKVPCPDRRRLGDKYAQCFVCQRREVTYYTFTGYAENPAAAQAYLDTQEHVAYLALFGRDLLKVGVASAGRRLRRTLEQGAQAGLFWAHANGADIRVLERHTSRTFAIKEQVTTLQKIKRFGQQLSPPAAQDVLLQKRLDIAQALPPDLAQQLDPQPDFQFLGDRYHLDLPPGTADVRLIKIVGTTDTYSGVVRGVVGSVVVLQAPDQQVYALPIKRLQGYMVEIGVGLQPMQLANALQVVRLDA